MAIVSHSNESQTRWDRGEFKVMLESPGSSQPMGFCDGSAADENEILEMAEGEGAEVMIDKKPLKSGRAVWTIRTVSGGQDEESADF